MNVDMESLTINWDKTSFDIPVWVCVDDAWLYIGDTLSKVLYQIENEYRQDKHLVG